MLPRRALCRQADALFSWNIFKAKHLEIVVYCCLGLFSAPILANADNLKAQRA